MLHRRHRERTANKHKPQSNVLEDGYNDHNHWNTSAQTDRQNNAGVAANDGTQQEVFRGRDQNRERDFHREPTREHERANSEYVAEQEPMLPSGERRSFFESKGLNDYAHKKEYEPKETPPTQPPPKRGPSQEKVGYWLLCDKFL